MTVKALCTDTGLQVEAESYRLHFLHDRPYARLSDAAGAKWADLCLAWSLHTLAGMDETAALSPPVVTEDAQGVRVTLEAVSSIWRRKRLVLTCRDDLLQAHLAVEGGGALTDCSLLGGYYSGSLRWGSGFFQSGSGFDLVFDPEPTCAERRTISAAETAIIDANGTSLPGLGHWFFTPPPFCYVLGRMDRPAYETGPGWPGEGPWLTLGLAAGPGEHQFTSFRYEGGEGAFSLRLTYEGQTRVDGSFQTPSLLFLFAPPDPYAGLAGYVQRLRAMNLASEPAMTDRLDWWRRPIFCGWGAQCALAAEVGGRAPDHCRQENYDAFLAHLAGHGVKPGTVVLDDKWQKDYATCLVDQEKWPDLKGWIARRHGEGQRVLLWWKAWDPEGLPPESCVRNAAGLPVAADPTNPAYADLLRAGVRRMLGREGYDADGFKIDFSARTPSGPGLSRHGAEWGIELLHLLLSILYHEAKRVKPEALVITHTPNPYFADVTDMIRLNDINGGSPVVPQMRHRARVARAACPEALIDTDDWPMPDRTAWRDYLRIQPDLGVVSLYYASRLDSGEPLEEADYEALRLLLREKGE